MAICVAQVSKSYHYFQALKQVTFDVHQGSCFALFGPNGSGKTTLLKILATLQRPSSGGFNIMGHDGLMEREKIRKLLFVMAHGSYLYEELSAEENILFRLALRGEHPSLRELKLTLDRVGIGAFSGLKIRFFSAGMKKRLSLALAMLIRPKVLLMDEPYSSLDEQGMQVLNSYIQEVTREGSTVLMASHDRVRSAQVAAQAGLLHKGEIRRIDTKDLAGDNALF